MGAQARDAKNEARPEGARAAGEENSRAEAPSVPRDAAPAPARRKRAREPSDPAEAEGDGAERPGEHTGAEPAKPREPAAPPKRARDIAPKDDAPPAEGAKRLKDEQPEGKAPDTAESQPTASTGEKPAETDTQKGGSEKPAAAPSGAEEGEQRERPVVASQDSADSEKPGRGGEKPASEGEKPASGGEKPTSGGEKPASERTEEPAGPSSEKPAEGPAKPAEKPAAASTPSKSGFSAFTASASPFASVKNAGSEGASTPSKLGFGAFASTSSPFIRTQATGDAEAKERGADWARQDGEEPAPKPEPQDNVVRKRTIQLPETEIKTGEEEEKTVHAVRAKLFHMASDQSWKERGMGVLKINVSTAAEAPARLVMRADGVLRVILNVVLFPGMLCELEQEKYIRIVAMEAEGLSHFAIRLANQGEAAALLHALREHIPERKET